MLLDCKKKTRTLERVERNEGCEEQRPRIWTSPSLALMDVPGSACKQMVAALVTGSLETREDKLVFFPPFQYNLGSKSVQANLEALFAQLILFVAVPL